MLDNNAAARVAQPLKELRYYTPDAYIRLVKVLTEAPTAEIGKQAVEQFLGEGAPLPSPDALRVALRAAGARETAQGKQRASRFCLLCLGEGWQPRSAIASDGERYSGLAKCNCPADAEAQPCSRCDRAGFIEPRGMFEFCYCAMGQAKRTRWDSQREKVHASIRAKAELTVERWNGRFDYKRAAANEHKGGAA